VPSGRRGFGLPDFPGRATRVPRCISTVGVLASVLGLLLLGHENVRLAFLVAQPTPDVGGAPTHDGLILRSWRR
jgi:hypothetical protein